MGLLGIRRMLVMAVLVTLVVTAGGAGAAGTSVEVHCESGDSLQAAIDAAAPGTTLSISGTCLGNFTVGTSLNLTGVATAGQPTLDGDHAGTVLTVSSGANVRVAGLVVQNGLSLFFDGRTHGGGIDNSGTLRLGKTTVSQNTDGTVDDGVGGIMNTDTGILTITDSTVTGNSGYFAGSIYVWGSVTLVNSTVSGNTGFFGAGIYKFGGPLSLSRSRVIGNTATGPDGGGIYLAGPGNLSLTGSTVSGNTACDIC